MRLSLDDAPWGRWRATATTITEWAQPLCDVRRERQRHGLQRGRHPAGPSTRRRAVGPDPTVTENGATLCQGAYTDSLPRTLTGSGYQMVQVTVTDIAGNSTSTEQGKYVQ